MGLTWSLHLNSAQEIEFLAIEELFNNYDTIRYDTRWYFNVRSKADMSQLNLPHGKTTTKSVQQKEN